MTESLPVAFGTDGPLSEAATSVLPGADCAGHTEVEKHMPDQDWPVEATAGVCGQRARLKVHERIDLTPAHLQRVGQLNR